MANAETKSDNKWIKALSIILAVSLAFNLILYIKSAELFPAKKDLLERNVELSKQMSDYRNEINNYKGISKKIDDVVEDAKKKLDIKEQQIVALKGEKRVKEKQNQVLLVQLDSLQDQYLGVIDSLLVEREQQKVVNQKIEALQSVIVDLNARLGIAEMLVGDNLVATPLKKTKSEKRQPSAMVKRTSEIEVCIDILENRMSKPGKQQVYIVITSPNAEVLVDQGAGITDFFHPEYKTPAHCSKIEEIDFQNKKIPLCSTIIPERISGTGLYLVEVFTDSHKLGMTSFTLK